jgi:methylmalonyl-CoA mutase N-terminal domain/subunit
MRLSTVVILAIGAVVVTNILVYSPAPPVDISKPVDATSHISQADFNMYFNAWSINGYHCAIPGSKNIRELALEANQPTSTLQYIDGVCSGK